MGRRRLQTILATTLLAAGLSTVPAFAQDLGGVTSTVEEAATSATDPVTSTTGDLTDTVEDTTDELLDPAGEPTEDASDEPSDDATSTDDDPVSADLRVDVAPEDEDGSPQLEVDGGLTVGDQAIDVGGATDPIEDAVDPDPEPQPDDASQPSDGTDPSGTAGDGQRPGGLLPGSGVAAAGGDARPAQPASDSTSSDASTVGQSFAAFGALNRGWGLDRMSGGTMPMRSGDVVPPEVAAPLSDEPVGAERPQTADRDVAELAVQSAGPLGTEDGGPLPAMLKAFALALLAGTVLRARQVLDRA